MNKSQIANFTLQKIKKWLFLQRIFDYDKRHRCVPLTEEYWKAKPAKQKFEGWLFHFLGPFV